MGNNRFKSFDKRLAMGQLALFVPIVVCLIIHLFLIQIIDLKGYRVRAKRQRISNSFIMRGNILDRNGMKLATDMVYFDVGARPADYDHSPEELAKKLAPLLKMSTATLAEKLNRTDLSYISLKKNVDRHVKDSIAKLGLREITLDKKSVRTYPQGSMASHVLGYYNFDAEIGSGVELTANDKLSSMENSVVYEKTPRGNVIYNFSTDPVAATKPTKGKNITLTIDTAIQHICEKELY